MSILSLSHTDLDGISSQIVLRQFKGEITRMNMSYGKIDEYLEILEDYCEYSRPSQVWITDLSFTIKQLDNLLIITEQHKDILFYFIDHHPPKDGFDDSKYNTNNFFIKINKDYSATKNLFLLLIKDISKEKTQYYDKLKEYVEYVDTYDLWRTKEAKFNGSLVYNALFWEFKKDYYYSRFKDEFKLRNSDKETYRGLVNKKNKLFNKLDKSGRIFRHQKRIFMIFLDDFQNYIQLDYPDFDTYIIITSYNSVSIRIKQGLSDEGKLKDIIVNKMLDNDKVSNAGGHNQAFGGTLKDITVKEQIEFSKELLQIVDNGLDTI